MAEGFLNLLKPPAVSSHDMVNAVRKILHEKRVGHVGTLDPAAAGVLPIAVGRATRLIEYLPGDKSYRAQIRLGLATDSGDETGLITERRENFAMPSREELQAALTGFTGRIRQTPPAHSAIKINGKKAYNLARRGQDAAVPSREIMIKRLTLLDIVGDSFFIDVDCSKGTYIRSLATDIGKKFSLPAVLTFLVRTRVGDFRLDASHTLEELATGGESLLIGAERCLTHIPRFNLPHGREKAFCNGLSTALKEILPPLVTVFADEKFLGMGRFDKENGALCPLKIFG